MSRCDLFFLFAIYLLLLLLECKRIPIFPLNLHVDGLATQVSRLQMSMQLIGAVGFEQIVVGLKFGVVRSGQLAPKFTNPASSVSRPMLRERPRPASSYGWRAGPGIRRRGVTRCKCAPPSGVASLSAEAPPSSLLQSLVENIEPSASHDSIEHAPPPVATVAARAAADVAGPPTTPAIAEASPAATVSAQKQNGNDSNISAKYRAFMVRVLRAKRGQCNIRGRVNRPTPPLRPSSFSAPLGATRARTLMSSTPSISDL